MTAIHQVLFVCGKNAGRSQMGAAFFNAVADPTRFVGMSAGLDPASHVHPEVVTVMAELGFDLSGVRPTELTARMQSETFFLVTLGCGDRCPMFPAIRRADWVFEDPHGKPLARVRAIRDEIQASVAALVAEKGWGRLA